MAFGNRIRFFRKRNRLTMKALGRFLGFKASNADIRISKYESEKRRPKRKVVNGLAQALGVSPEAILVPDIESMTGLMHTFFAIEDMYGLTINTSHGKPCLFVTGTENPQQDGLLKYLEEWNSVKIDLLYGRITKTQYDDWRYNYPKIERKKVNNDVTYTPLEEAIE